MKVIRCEPPFCVVVLFMNHKICLNLFAILVYLNEKVTSAGYPHINISSQIQINKLMTVDLKSIM